MNRRTVLKQVGLVAGAVAAVAATDPIAHAAIGGEEKSRPAKNLKLVASYLAA